MAGGPSLTLREYTAGFILLSFTFGVVYSFSGAMFNEYNTGLQGQEDQVNKLQSKIENAAPNTGTGINKTNSISTENSGSFFLGSVLTVIETVTSGLGAVPQLLSQFVGVLNFSPKIIALASIPVAAIIWEVVSLYRGLRT